MRSRYVSEQVDGATGIHLWDVVDVRLAAAGALTIVAGAALAGMLLPSEARPAFAAAALTAAVILSSILGASLTRLSRRVSRIASVMDAGARGDLDLAGTAADGRGDVLGRMAADADSIVGRLRQMAMAIHRLGERLDAESEFAYQTGVSITNATEATAKDAAAAAEAATTVSDNMHVVASATEEVALAVREVSHHASRASATATEAATRAFDASKAVAELGDASERVGEVVTFVRHVARQTHLLAMNATIQAAHAGEAGVAFAVVAGEVKTLAKEASDATESVSTTVSALQTDASSATESINAIAEIIGNVNDNQTAIAASVEQQTLAAQQIGRTAAETADSSTRIASAVSELSLAIRTIAFQAAVADTKAGEFAVLRDEARELLRDVQLGELAAVGAADPNRPRASAYIQDGVTIVEDYVMGSGLNEIDYVGSWRHSEANAQTGGTNSYTVMTDDYAVLRFTGSQVRVYMVTQQNQAIVGVSIDGGPESFGDCYSPTRQRGVLVFESPTLTPGNHTVRVRSTDMKNPDSAFFWTSLDRFEVE